MKRPLIITIGIVIILLVLGLWVYLLAFGAPQQPREVFTNLGITAPKERGLEATSSVVQKEDATQLALSGSPLQQLTTRAIAGFGLASSSNKVRYVERGTGYVYEIDTLKGIEKQISLLTIPQTVKALFSPKGSAVAITSYSTAGEQISVGTIPKDGSEMTITKLERNSENISFKDETLVYYTQKENQKTTGYQLSLSTLTKTVLFSIPITDVNVFWGNGLNNIYVQTRPTQYQEGYLYQITKGSLTPVGKAAYGLTSLIQNGGVITSYINKSNVYASAWTHDSTTTEEAMPMFSEKCSFSAVSEKRVWCASPVGALNGSYLENWYKGTTNSQDYIWRIDLASQSGTLIVNLQKLSGKTIDVYGMISNSDDSLLFFQNKIDQTLWLYRTAGK